MLVKFGQANKDINSTKVPALSKELDCQLKDGVSITNPVLFIRGSQFDIGYNYCYIPKWSRYYFVNNIKINTGGVFEVSLSVDVLASFKNDILEAKAYVRRSQSHGSTHIPDSTWSHSSDYSTITKDIDIGLSTDGCYLLFTASSETETTNASPAVCVYAVTGLTLRLICSYLFSSDFFESSMSGVDTVSKSLAKTFFNPFSYVLKCMWLPISVTDLSTVTRKIAFGWWTTDYDGNYLITGKKKILFDIAMPAYSDWTNRDASWTDISIYVPSIGELSISPEYCGQTLKATLVIDLTNGHSDLFIKDGNFLVQSASGQMGADVQLSALYEDIVGDLGSRGGLIKSAISGIGSFIKSSIDNATADDMGNLSIHNVGDIVSDTVHGAQSALQPKCSTIGANGNKATLTEFNHVLISVHRYNKLGDDKETLGRMCCKTMWIKNLTGYTEIVNPHINCGATASEITMINAFLSGGFYIE